MKNKNKNKNRDQQGQTMSDIPGAKENKNPGEVKSDNYQKPGGKDQQKKQKRVKNDPHWYALSDSILRDAASFPFSKPMGATILADGNADDKWYSTYSVKYFPTFGSKDNVALQKATMAFYSFMRQQNSGARNYEGPDLFIYMMSAFSITQLLLMAKRIMGCCSYFSLYNSQLSNDLVKAAGGNFYSYSRNAADFRKKYNELVNQFNKNLHIPANYAYYSRQAFLLNHVFASSSGTRSQFFCCVPTHTFKFKADATNGSALEVHHLTDFFDSSWDTYLGEAERIMNEIIANEDIQIMSGDIWKAYGDANCIKMEEIPLDYITPVVVSDDFEMQFRNAHYCPDLPKFFVNDIGEEAELALYQKNARIYTCPAVYNPNEGKFDSEIPSVILDIDSESPTPAEVMESTRFISVINGPILQGYSDPSGSGYSFTDIICGTEVIHRIDIIYDNEYFTSQSAVVDNLTAGDAYEAYKFMMQSRYCPLIKCIRGFNTANDYSMKLTDVIGRFHNIREIQGEDLAELHRSAILGLLDIPVLSVNR